MLPPDGWPVTDLQSSSVSAQMVALGIGVAPSREQRLPDLGPVSVDDLAAVEQVVRACAPGPDDDIARGAPRASWRGASCSRWSSVLRVPGEGPVLRPFDGLRRRHRIGTVLARMGDPWVRDAVLLTAVPGAGDVPEAMAAGGPLPQAQRLFENVFGPGEPASPDPDLLRAVRAALAHVVRHATGSRRAAPLAVMAWAAWWEGDGASACDLADMALADDPENRFADLIDGAVLAGIAPGWVSLAREADLSGGERSA